MNDSLAVQIFKAIYKLAKVPGVGGRVDGGDKIKPKLECVFGNRQIEQFIPLLRQTSITVRLTAVAAHQPDLLSVTVGLQS